MSGSKTSPSPPVLVPPNLSSSSLAPPTGFTLHTIVQGRPLPPPPPPHLFLQYRPPPGPQPNAPGEIEASGGPVATPWSHPPIHNPAHPTMPPKAIAQHPPVYHRPLLVVPQYYSPWIPLPGQVAASTNSRKRQKLSPSSPRSRLPTSAATASAATSTSVSTPSNNSSNATSKIASSAASNPAAFNARPTTAVTLSLQQQQRQQQQLQLMQSSMANWFTTKRGAWDDDEVERLVMGKQQHGNNWTRISQEYVKTRNNGDCSGKNKNMTKKYGEDWVHTYKQQQQAERQEQRKKEAEQQRKQRYDAIFTLSKHEKTKAINALTEEQQAEYQAYEKDKEKKKKEEEEARRRRHELERQRKQRYGAISELAETEKTKAINALTEEQQAEYQAYEKDKEKEKEKEARRRRHELERQRKQRYDAIFTLSKPEKTKAVNSLTEEQQAEYQAYEKKQRRSLLTLAERNKEDVLAKRKEDQRTISARVSQELAAFDEALKRNITFDCSIPVSEYTDADKKTLACGERLQKIMLRGDIFNGLLDELILKGVDKELLSLSTDEGKIACSVYSDIITKIPEKWCTGIHIFVHVFDFPDDRVFRALSAVIAKSFIDGMEDLKLVIGYQRSGSIRGITCGAATLSHPLTVMNMLQDLIACCQDESSEHYGVLNEDLSLRILCASCCCRGGLLPQAKVRLCWISSYFPSL